MTSRSVVVLLHGVQWSATTWWRVGEDLADLGCAVRALDLPGHGGRGVGEQPLSLDRMAADVEDQLAGVGADLMVGHSMGALVGLTLAARRPDLVATLMIEDPPALGPALDPRDVAADIKTMRRRAEADAQTLEAEMRADNPLWARADPANSVGNVLALDVAAVTAWLRRERWDLTALVTACPVPLHLLVANGPESATTEPARTEVLRRLGPDRVTEVASGHSVHCDRPGAWVGTVVRLLAG